MPNILGLVSGNFKRHLKTHGITKTKGVYGIYLAELAIPNCDKCQRHAEHFRGK